MPNKQYQAGRRFEYECIRMWEKRDYKCIRASGSHGLYDIVAFRPDRKPEFIQCKRVADSPQGRRLIEKFREDTISAAFFHQTIAVRVKGTKDVLTYTV